MALPETIPTDVIDLTALIRSTPVGDRLEIVGRLEKQLGDHTQAYRLYEEAESYVVNDELCGRLRRQLTAALDAAAAELRKAERLIVELTSPQVYDIEYTEGPVADDLLHLVAKAHRAARIASTVQKTIPA
jgi:hypothetical protein